MSKILARFATIFLLVASGVSAPAKAGDKFDSHSGCRSNSDCAATERCRIEKDILAGLVTAPNATSGICEASVAPGLVAKGCHSGFMCLMTLHGDITAQQASAMMRFVGQIPASSKPKRFSMVIRSDGGDVDAAMAIGRLLRANRAHIEVTPDSRCASACVFVLAGAVGRVVLGTVVIHRPYRAVAETYGFDNAQTAFRVQGERIRAYLEEMNVPTSLYEAMVAVPSESGRRLTREELAYYRIGQDDPVWAEEQNAAQAKRRGLSMSEYLRRKGAVDACWHDKYQRGLDAAQTETYMRAAKECDALWK